MPTAPNSLSEVAACSARTQPVKKPVQDDDGQGTDADGVHLGENIGPVARGGKDVGDGAAGHGGVGLDGRDAILGEVLNGGERHSFVGSLYQMRERCGGTWRVRR